MINIDTIDNVDISYPHGPIEFAYKGAADILYKEFLRLTKPGGFLSDLDEGLIYPILYLYRHSIELILKSILNSFPIYELVKGHNLEYLWEEIINILSSKYPRESFAINFNEVSMLIKYLNELDPDSQHFRYLKDSKGNAFKFNNKELDLNLYRKNIKTLVHELYTLSDNLYEAYLISIGVEN